MNDIQMLPEENFLNHGFQLYKIGLEQKTLNLIEALLMELSLVSNQSTLNDSFARNKHSNIGLLEGIMKVLEWKIKGNINDQEFSMLYTEWLKSKQYIVQDHLISFSYDYLIPKNSIINYLRNQQHPDLAFIISQYMELLNSQFNEQLSIIAKISPRQIEVSEDIYIMFDDEGTGYIGMDQIMFLYMALVKKQRLNLPYSKNQFFADFHNFVSLIPQINGNISLRSFKTYLILSSVSNEDIQEIFEGCKELLTEFGWNQFNQMESSDNQFIFPKPFNEAFVECMNALHQQGYVHDEDLMRDEYLNTYNIFLNEEYYKIVGQLTNHSSYLNCPDQTKLQRALFSSSLEFYNERVLQGLNIKISQIIFNAFVIKFDQKIQQYATQFLNKYSPQSYQSYQSYDSKSDLSQQKSSKIFQKSRQSKPSIDMRGEIQKLEKENYKPKINFLEDSVYSNNNIQNNYHSWNESSTQQELQSRSNLPFFQASVQQTQQSRSSIRDSSYLDNLQNNINKNIKNPNYNYMGKGNSYMLTNQPQMQSQKQQLFSQFTSQNRINEQREGYPIEYNVKLSDLDNQQPQRQKFGNNQQQPNKNLRNRSKSPIQLQQVENQNRIGINSSKITTPQQQKQQFQIISKPPLDGRQNLRYSSQNLNNQDIKQQQQANNFQKQRSGVNNHSSNSGIRQVTPTKSVSPIKFHITLSNSQKQNIQQQKPYINEFQAFQPAQGGLSFQKQTTSSKTKKINQGSSVKKAKSFINMRANSVENVNHFNSDISLRQQTSMGFREQTPDKQFQMTNSNWNENSNLKNRKQSQSSNNYMQQSLNSFQNQSTVTAIQRSKSPQVRKSQTIQMWNKRVEPFEKVMQRLTSQQGVSPMKELFKKKPFH